MTIMADRGTLSVEEAARYIGISRSKVLDPRERRDPSLIPRWPAQVALGRARAALAGRAGSCGDVPRRIEQPAEGLDTSDRLAR